MARSAEPPLPGPGRPALSVIVPTLGEAARIRVCIDSLAALRAAGAEVIVSDGGSNDGTVALAEAEGVTVVAARRGRARQMNDGARRSDGRLLAFLHADTVPSAAACVRLQQLAASQTAVWGRFDVRLSGPGAAFRLIETMMNARSRLTGIATGDQLLFVSRTLFDAVGGFPDVALMEDIRMSARLRALQAPLCARETVETSSRKWREHGVVRTVLLMWRLRLAHALGADPAGLARRYYGAG